MYKQMTRSGSAPGCAGDKDRDGRRAAQSPLQAPRSTWLDAPSSPLCQQTRRADEHHHDEKSEGEHIAPFEIGEQSAERDDFGEYERSDEAADEISQAAKDANQERDRSE